MAGTKIVAGLIAALLAGGCSRSRSTIVVGSKNFTEQLVLGEILAQQLERKLGQKVERKLNLGGTLLAHQALVNGEIDLYPEYTGHGADGHSKAAAIIGCGGRSARSAIGL